jgi:hypothetical protein
MSTSLLTPLTAPIGAVALAAIDTTTIGQTVLALIVIAGYIASQLTAKRVASQVADKVDTAAQVQQEKIQEVHVLVNSQMSAALARIDELEKALNLRAGQAAVEATSPPLKTRMDNLLREVTALQRDLNKYTLESTEENT